jgi:hypothetical protein
MTGSVCAIVGRAEPGYQADVRDGRPAEVTNIGLDLRRGGGGRMMGGWPMALGRKAWMGDMGFEADGPEQISNLQICPAVLPREGTPRFMKRRRITALLADGAGQWHVALGNPPEPWNRGPGGGWRVPLFPGDAEPQFRRDPHHGRPWPIAGVQGFLHGPDAQIAPDVRPLFALASPGPTPETARLQAVAAGPPSA